jgi:tRNA pseudouridine38-40 synthase
MNRMLPIDIRVWNVQAAPEPVTEMVNGKESTHAWNAMRKCSGKLYSYRLCLGDTMDPIERLSRWQLERAFEIDPDHLKRILQQYQGSHDFVCFAGALEQQARKAGGRAIGTIRTVQSVNMIREDNDDGDDSTYYRIDIYLDGALYKMVRNMVGTAIGVCRGKISETTFLELLDPVSSEDASLSRSDNPCLPAPPQGLTLERVYYPNDDF